MAKFLLGKTAEMKFFTGASFDAEAGLGFSYTKD